MNQAATAADVGLGPRIVPCEEQGPVDIPLAEVLDPAGRLLLNPDIEKGDFFSVYLKKGALVLKARGYVGYIPLNERIVVHVRPRVPVSNLSRVINLSGEPPTVLTSLRGYATGADWNDSLLDVYTNTLIGHVETIMRSGMLREYVRREEVSSFPRGRVMLHRTLQDLHARGVHHAAHVTWFERTPDNGPNQCIKYAIWLLAKRYIELGSKHREARKLHRRLNSIYAVFAGVELDHDRRFMLDPQVLGSRPLPTLRSYYRDALNVALAIIEQRSVLIDSPTGAVRLPSIVLNMNYVFEAYIRNVLRLHAETHSWRAKILDGNDEGSKDLFDDKPSPRATPDVVVRDPDGSTSLVLEVKNVPIRDEFSEPAHRYQAISYAATYRAHRVVLVHPRSSANQEGGMRLLGDVDQIGLFQYRFDLGAPDLAVEEERFCRDVAGLLPAGTAAQTTS